MAVREILSRWLPKLPEVDEAHRIVRPGAGPVVVAFSRAEVAALSRFAIGYPMEEATEREAVAFDTGLQKIREAGERKDRKRAKAKKYGGGGE